MQRLSQAISFHGNRVKFAVLHRINANQRLSWSNLFNESLTPPIAHRGLENTTVAEILKTKGDDDAGKVYLCCTNDTVYDAVKNVGTISLKQFCAKKELSNVFSLTLGLEMLKICR